MTKDEALKLALEALENVYGKGKRCEAAIAAIKQVLAQPEQEPVVVSHSIEIECQKCGATEHGSLSFTQSPPQRTWVGLTGFEQKELMAMSARDAVFATEAKLKEKNT